jgi:Glycosyl transferase family group 2
VSLVHWFTVGMILFPTLFTVVDFLPAWLKQSAKVFPIDSNAPPIDDFAVLVPIYGQTKYLQNVPYLRQYGDRVVLCTTDRESDEFYRDLDAIARKEGFSVFRAPFPKIAAAAAGSKRNTGGTIRDRVIREALEDLDVAYVVCIDADTETARPINDLVSSFAQAGIDIASICVVPLNSNTLMARFQRHEYRIAMNSRRFFPWLISGACHIAKTEVHREIMRRHSLFFQGNDAELGVIGEACGFQVGHMLYDVPTIVPDKFYAWWRQRCAWSGGQFRLAVVNLNYSRRLPAFYLYMSMLVTLGAPLRWISLLHPNWVLAFVLFLYVVGLFISNWRHRDLALILYPFYALISSMVLTPLGFYFYIRMSRKDSNWGVIRHLPPKRIREQRARSTYFAHSFTRRASFRLLVIGAIMVTAISMIDSDSRRNEATGSHQRSAEPVVSARSG